MVREVKSFVAPAANKYGGNLLAACRDKGFHSNTTLTQYAIKVHNIKTKHPEKLNISDLYSLAFKDKAKSDVELSRISNGKPITQKVFEIIG